MDETVFTVAVVLFSLLIPSALYRVFIRQNRARRDYNPVSGRYVSRKYKFMILIGTAFLSFFLLEPLFRGTLYTICLQYPFSEWMFAIVGVSANYAIIR